MSDGRDYYRVERDATDLNTHPLIMEMTEEEAAAERAFSGKRIELATGDEMDEYAAWWDMYYECSGFLIREEVPA